MFAFIRGIIMTATPSYCVLDVRGVGYKLFIPHSTFAKLPTNGEEALLHCSFVVRELSQALYGFLNVEEKELFELLMGVTGVGPKMALSIIGHFLPQDLHHAISGNNVTALCKIPGVGKKTAERLIVEMRDKLKEITSIAPVALSIKISYQQAISDAMSALIHLGYTQATAQKAVQKTLELMPEDVKLPDLITHALKHV